MRAEIGNRSGTGRGVPRNLARNRDAENPTNTTGNRAGNLSEPKAPEREPTPLSIKRGVGSHGGADALTSTARWRRQREVHRDLLALSRALSSLADDELDVLAHHVRALLEASTEERTR